MLVSSLLTLAPTHNITLSWLGCTFFGGLIGLLTGIILMRPLMLYRIILVKPIAWIIEKCVSFLQPGELEFLLILAMPILSPILGIGFGVAVSQSLFLSKMILFTSKSWIIFTGIAHFIPTFLYSILLHVPTALNFAIQSPNILKIKKIIQTTEYILVLIVWGGLIGLAQWILIKEYLNFSTLWLIISALGISIGIAISTIISRIIIVFCGRNSVLLAFYTIGLLALIPYGFFTGKLLEMFLKQEYKISYISYIILGDR